jgi:D-arabinose 1-dehydrogenase-like Zn-dependent alcohol dehydrogenase
MKTLLYPAWDRVEFTDRPRPSPAGDEVLLRVAACGLRGSELEAFRTHSPRRTPPLVLGHEFCGVVEPVAADVAGVRRAGGAYERESCDANEPIPVPLGREYRAAPSPRPAQPQRPRHRP